MKSVVRIVRQFIVSIILMLSATVVPAQERSVEEFARRVAASLTQRQQDELLKTCQSGDLSSIYFASYDLDGLLAAAEATGRDEFLKPAVTCIDAIIAAGRDQNNDGYLDFYHSVDKAWDSTAKGISSSTLLKGLRPIPRAAPALPGKTSLVSTSLRPEICPTCRYPRHLASPRHQRSRSAVYRGRATTSW